MVDCLTTGSQLKVHEKYLQSILSLFDKVDELRYVDILRALENLGRGRIHKTIALLRAQGKIKEIKCGVFVRVDGNEKS